MIQELFSIYCTLNDGIYDPSMSLGTICFVYTSLGGMYFTKDFFTWFLDRCTQENKNKPPLPNPLFVSKS